MEFISERKKTPVRQKVDVVVVGGGPGGFGAAMAAARNGADTLLIERYGFLGGMLTAGLVRWFPIDKLTPLKAYDETRPLQGGIVTEFIRKLMDVGGSFDPDNSYDAEVGFETYFATDMEMDKVIMPRMLQEAGCKILLHSLVVDAVKEDNTVKGVIIESKSGRQAILADRVIDASGDADYAAAAGAEFEKSNESLLMTLKGFMTNVDTKRAIDYSRKENFEKFDRLVELATKNGDLKLAEKRVAPGYPLIRLRPFQMLDPQKMPANWRRRGESGGWIESIPGDCSNVDDLTNAELKTREMVIPIVNFYRKYVPGYENAYLSFSSFHIGIRESRRVLGGYYLTYDNDVKKGLRHKDSIVKARDCNDRNKTLSTPDNFPVWDIPYRCIVPKTIDGLLTAGRCISIDHKTAAIRTPRDLSTCMCIGEAAGTAAALSIQKNVQPRDLDINLLQDRMRKQGANLD